MKLILYKTTSPQNVIGKTLSDPYDLDIHFKRGTQITTPFITLKYQDLFGYNYASIPDFNRLYFVTQIERVNMQLVTLQLETDVLETYKKDILQGDAIITKSPKKSMMEQAAITSVESENIRYNSDITLPKTSTLALTTIGG